MKQRRARPLMLAESAETRETITIGPLPLATIPEKSSQSRFGHPKHIQIW
jgi:hypothetical protein